MNFISVRLFFNNLDSAVEALIITLEDARVTEKQYSFGSLSAQQVLSSGLLLVGDVQHLVEKIQKLSGVLVTSD